MTSIGMSRKDALEMADLRTGDSNSSFVADVDVTVIQTPL
jgi:hypothetical protein